MITAEPSIATHGYASTRRLLRMLAGAMILGTLVGILLMPGQTWPALLVGSLYVLGLSLGALFFLALLRVCGARWSRGIEFIPQALAAGLHWPAIMLAIVLVLGMAWIYPWSPQHEVGEVFTGFKGVWLDRGFFWLRSAVYLGIWILFARLLAATTFHLHQDTATARRRHRLSVAFLVVFALTFIPASFDWIMTIEPHWFSTIFGIHHFAGVFLGTLATIAVAAIALRRSRGMRKTITDVHLLDLGRLMFAFSIFWGYTWFSQYMLIWYANLPEVTPYYALRHAGAWQFVAILNVLCNWAGPFLILMSRAAKRSEGPMLQAGILILVGRLLDLGMMILPPYSSESIWILLPAAVASVGMIALMLLLLFRFIRVSPDLRSR